MALFRRGPVVAAAAPVRMPVSPNRVGSKVITAAAYVLGQAGDRNKPGEVGHNRRQGWQEEVWGYYDTIGEFHNAANFVANAMSRLRLAPGWLDDDDNVIRIDDDAKVPAEAKSLAKTGQKLLRNLRARSGGQKRILFKLGLNLTGPAECYLLATDVKQGTKTVSRQWEVLSVDELRPKTDGSGFVRHRGPGFPPVDLPPDSYPVRIWLDHPRYVALADSSIRPLLDTLEELALLTREVRSQTLSRVAGPGILLIPQEIVWPNDPNVPDSQAGNPVQRLLQEAMMAPIADKAAPSGVVPLVIEAPMDAIDHIKHLDFRSAHDTIQIQKRTEAVQRFAQGSPLPVEQTTGHQQTTYCADSETEVLSRDGWRSYRELAVGDEILTLNHRSGLAEWQPVTAVNVFDVHDEPMLRITGKAHDSLTTANHRWPVLDAHAGLERRWQVSDGLMGSHRVVTAARPAALPTEAKYTDDFVELVAWHWTEGHVHRQAGIAGVTTITQSAEANPEKCARIRAMLHRLLGEPLPSLRGKPGRARAWTERRDADRDIRRFVLSTSVTAEMEVVAPRKIVSAEFVHALTSAQLELFIDVSLMADGYRTNMDSRVITQAKAEALDGIELATILTGRTPYRWWNVVQDRLSYYLAISERTTIAVPQRTVRSERHAHREWVSYTGDVWCPTTRNATWMARRAGKVYFTGNSNAAQIDEDTYKAYIEPFAIGAIDSLAVGYYQPQLMSSIGLDPLGYPPEIIERSCIFIDASELLTSPDKTKESLEGWDRGLISDETWLRVNGFSEDDKPDREELMARIRMWQQKNSRETMRGLVSTSAEDTLIVPDPDASKNRPPMTELPPPDNQLPSKKPVDPAQRPDDPEPPPPPSAGAADGSGGVAPGQGEVDVSGVPTPAATVGQQTEGQSRSTMVTFAAASVWTAVERAAERSGARLRQRANGRVPADVWARIADAPDDRVPSVLTADAVERIIPVDELLGGEFKALRRTNRVLLASMGHPDPDGAAARLQAFAHTQAIARLRDPNHRVPVLPVQACLFPPEPTEENR